MQSGELRARNAAIEQLFLAFPLGATVNAMDLYVTKTEGCSIYDLQAACQHLINTHRSTRAPSIAQVLDCARNAAAQRRPSGGGAAPPHEDRATPVDFRRLREITERGLDWDVEQGVWRVMSKQELRDQAHSPCDPEHDRRLNPKYPLTRAALNAGWLEHVQNKPRPAKRDETWGTLEHALQEAPF